MRKNPSIDFEIFVGNKRSLVAQLSTGNQRLGYTFTDLTSATVKLWVAEEGDKGEKKIDGVTMIVIDATNGKVKYVMGDVGATDETATAGRYIGYIEATNVGADLETIGWKFGFEIQEKIT